jgi:hypothetical protein
MGRHPKPVTLSAAELRGRRRQGLGSASRRAPFTVLIGGLLALRRRLIDGNQSSLFGSRRHHCTLRNCSVVIGFPIPE